MPPTPTQLQSFVPVDERKRRALARTSSPGGGYRLAGTPPPPATSEEPQKGRSALAERLSEERETGELVRKSKSGLFSTRDHGTGEMR